MLFRGFVPPFWAPSLRNWAFLTSEFPQQQQQQQRSGCESDSFGADSCLSHPQSLPLSPSPPRGAFPGAGNRSRSLPGGSGGTGMSGDSDATKVGTFGAPLAAAGEAKPSTPSLLPAPPSSGILRVLPALDFWARGSSRCFPPSIFALGAVGSDGVLGPIRPCPERGRSSRIRGEQPSPIPGVLQSLDENPRICRSSGNSADTSGALRHRRCEDLAAKNSRVPGLEPRG